MRTSCPPSKLNFSQDEEGGFCWLGERSLNALVPLPDVATLKRSIAFHY